MNRDYTVNGLNQYKTAGTANFTYDARGNLTSDGTNSFGYSSENLLTSATVGGVSNTLAYDPMLRLSSIAGSTTTQFAYDGADLIADYDGTGALQHRYVFGPGVDEPIVEVASTGVRTWLSSDERGSIVARTDAKGSLVNANSYDEYGIPSSSNVGLFGYTGQAWISQLGMNYYKARIYSPTMGRFVQTDRIGAKDNANLYAYVHDDPVNSRDPTGECGGGCVVGIGIGLGLGYEILRQIENTGSIDFSRKGFEEDGLAALAGGAGAAGTIIFGSDSVGLAIFWGVLGADVEGTNGLINGESDAQISEDMLFGALNAELIGFSGLGIDGLLDSASYSTEFIASNGDSVIDIGGNFFTVAAQDADLADAFYSGLLAGGLDNITVSAYDQDGNEVNINVLQGGNGSDDPLGVDLSSDDPFGLGSLDDPSSDSPDPTDPGNSSKGLPGGSGN